MKNPLISVIMPCYNAERFINESVESILNQTYTNFEFIAIDDASTDKTYSILQDYSAKDNRIILIKNEKNLRLIKTLNKAISIAKGQYVARMDADDVSRLDRFEKQIQFLQSNPKIDIVSTGYYVIDENGKLISKKLPRQYLAKSCLFASFFYVPIGHPEIMGKALIFKENPYLEEECALHTEDYELWSRLLRKDYHLMNINECLLYYRINSNSVSRLYTAEQDKNFLICVQSHFRKYSNKSFPEHIVRILGNRINSSVKLSDLKIAIKEYAYFKSYFLEKEKITNRQIIKEINNIYYTHLFDICIQTFKFSSITVRIYIIYYFFYYLVWHVNFEIYSYLRNKVK